MGKTDNHIAGNDYSLNKTTGVAVDVAPDFQEVPAQYLLIIEIIKRPGITKIYYSTII